MSNHHHHHHHHHHHFPTSIVHSFLVPACHIPPEGISTVMDRLRGMTQTKRDTLTLQVWGWTAG
jgi:hypothetical protein